MKTWSVTLTTTTVWNGENAISVPERFSCAGYGGIDLSQMAGPGLTTYWQDTRTIGRTAVESLLAIMKDGPAAGRDLTVSGSLVAGKTVAELK